jgi:hypothetical protein
MNTQAITFTLLSDDTNNATVAAECIFLSQQTNHPVYDVHAKELQTSNTGELEEIAIEQHGSQPTEPLIADAYKKMKPDAVKDKPVHFLSGIQIDEVNLDRLAEHFKVRVEPARNGKKINNGQVAKPKLPTAVKPAPPKAVIPRSEKAKDYLRQAMQNSYTDEDGVDHLNASSSAQTRLGQALDINAHTPFNHPDLGMFNSLGGLWYYVGGETQNDIFRTLFGQQCRTQGKKIRLREVIGFKTIIAEATWLKVIADPALTKAMTESSLPFRSYHLQGDLGLPVSTVTEEWYMYVLETIREVLQSRAEGHEVAFPDFEYLDQPQRPRRAPRARY